MSRSPCEVSPGVWNSQTPLWQTNSLLAVKDGHALLCGPSYTRAEIEAYNLRSIDARQALKEAQQGAA